MKQTLILTYTCSLPLNYIFSRMCEILRDCCFKQSEQRAENNSIPEHLERPNNPPLTRLFSYIHTHTHSHEYTQICAHVLCYTSIYIHDDTYTYTTYAYLAIHTRETGASYHRSCFFATLICLTTQRPIQTFHL